MWVLAKLAYLSVLFCAADMGLDIIIIIFFFKPLEKIPEAG